MTKWTWLLRFYKEKKKPAMKKVPNFSLGKQSTYFQHKLLAQGLLERTKRTTIWEPVHTVTKLYTGTKNYLQLWNVNNTWNSFLCKCILASYDIFNRLKSCGLFFRYPNVAFKQRYSQSYLKYSAGLYLGTKVANEEMFKFYGTSTSCKCQTFLHQC